MYDRVIKDIFCKKCHRLAAQIERSKEGTRIMQGGKVLTSLLGDRTSIAGTKGNTVSIRCPSNHKVKIEV